MVSDVEAAFLFPRVSCNYLEVFQLNAPTSLDKFSASEHIVGGMRDQTWRQTVRALQSISVIIILIAHRLLAQPAMDSKCEIIAHRIRLSLFPQTLSFTCVDTVFVRRTDRSVNEIRLGVPRIYKIEDVRTSGRKADYAHEKDYLVISSLPRQDEIEVVVAYRGEFKFRSEFTRMTGDWAILRDEEVLVQAPKAIRSVRVTMEVPAGWEAVVVGELVSRSKSDERTSFTYQFEGTLSTLGWLWAGRAEKHEARLDGMPVVVYSSRPDTGEASDMIKRAQEALRFFSTQMPKYRFPRFTMIRTDDWLAGGNVLAVASPGVVFIKDRVFSSSDTFERLPAILPHEIAHQWWPLTVFVSGEDVALLSEGMCEYAALLFNKSQGTLTARDSLGHHPLLRALLTRVQKGKDLPLQKSADLRALPTQYLKSSYVHHMLRMILGSDSAMLAVYRRFTEQYGGRQAKISDFQKIAEEKAGRSLDFFFEQWVRKTGMPRLRIYNIKATSTPEGWETRGRVRIVGYEKYSTFVDVGVETIMDMLTTRVWLGRDTAGVYTNDVMFSIKTKDKPQRAILDPFRDVLTIKKLPPKFGDLRDPEDGLMIVGTRSDAGHLWEQARSDSAELERFRWSIRLKPDTSVTLADLQQDRVFLYGLPKANSVVSEHIRRFPIGFRGDSVLVSGAALYDSSISVVQVIENPFRAQGLMCWIAPLSAKAEAQWMFVDASWALMRGKDNITSGTWEIMDEDRVVTLD